MTILHFAYRMEIRYGEPASRCYFTIKCIPKEDDRQRLSGMQITLLPDAGYSYGEDSFGNRLIYGCAASPHDRFVFQITGDVKILQTDYAEKEKEERTGIFRFPHGKCVPGIGIKNYYDSLGLSKQMDPVQVCMAVMHQLFRDFLYVPGATQVDTKAEAAWEIGKGVCQDYVHIYITLLRMAGIPARYVCGLIVGEGASHAWAEALCHGKWIGFDPTNDCLVSDTYIKLGDGRDAADCAINRGILWGGGAQTQSISACVEK